MPGAIGYSKRANDVKNAPITLWVGRVPPCGLGDLALLSPDEQQRYDHYAFDELKQLFLHRRVWLRRMLGRYLGLPPQDILFGSQAMGKPVLQNPCAHGIHFSVSYSSAYVALALNERGAVGIDVEQRRPLSDMNAMMGLIAGPEELAHWNGLAQADRQDYFYRLWTRKEALLKACGAGLSYGLTQLDLREDREGIQQVQVQGQIWQVRSLCLRKGVSLALATSMEQGPMHEVAFVF